MAEAPAPPADASRCPRGDRVRREPEGDVASPHEGSVVLGPVPDAIRCRVLRMHSRLHIEIMTRRRSRWSTCRPLLAHRAESAHQRRVSAVVLWAIGGAGGPSCAIDVGQCARRLRRADSRATSRTRVESGAIGHAGGRGAESRRLPMGSAETYAVAPVLATTRRAPPVNWAQATSGDDPLTTWRRNECGS